MSFTAIQCSKCQHHTKVEDGKIQATCFNCGAALFTPSDPDPRQTKVDTRGTSLDPTEVRAKAYAFDSMLMSLACVSRGFTFDCQPVGEDQKIIANTMLGLMKQALTEGRQHIAQLESNALQPLKEKKP